MGVFDGLLNMMQLGADEDDDEMNRGYEESRPNVSRRSPANTAGAAAGGSKEQASSRVEDKRAENVTNIRTVKEQPPKAVSSRSPVAKRRDNNVGGNMQVCVIKPSNFEDSREITDTLLEGKPIFLNMEGLDIDIAQRIIDFASGSCYALAGNLQKVSNYIFLLTPSNVEISGDLAELLDTYHVGGIKTDF